MMNIFTRFFNWISGRDKYLIQIEKQEKLIDDLRNRPEVVTFLNPVKPEESEQYAAFIHQTWNNRFFKWFMNDVERAVIAKFKSGENADFSRGQLAMIELFSLKMNDISTNYIINRKTGVENG